MSDQNQALAVQTGGLFTVAPSSIFDNLDKLSQYREMATALAASSFIPEAFQKKPDECLIALEYAANLGMRPLMVMQNLHVVKGKPSWDGKFIGSVIKACGRFRNVRYDMGQNGVVAKAWVQGAYDPAGRNVENVPNLTCALVATDVVTGEEVRGTTVSIQMAVSEGWYGGKGSKWPNMPEQMLQYRAASFFGRIHVQDILLGMHTAEESYEIAQQEAGTGAVEIMEGVTGDAPKGRQRRQAVAAPTVEITGPTLVRNEAVVQTQDGPITVYSDTPPMVPAPVAEAITPPVAAAPAPAVVQPAPAAAAPVQPAPVATPAAFVIQPRHIAVLLKIQKDPLAVNLSEEERKAIKEFGNAYPDFVKLPQRMGSKTELTISPEGLEFLGSDPAAVAAYDELNAGSQDPGDMGEPPVAESAQMTNEPDPAATATMQVLRDPQPTPQEIRDAKQAEQYPATPAPAPAAARMLGPDSQGAYHAAGSQGAFAAWPPSGDPEQYKRDNAPAGSTAGAAPEGDSVSDLFDLPM